MNGKRLLLLTSDELLATYLSHALKNRQSHIDVQITYDPQYAMQILGQNQIDILVMDYLIKGQSSMGIQRFTKSLWPSCEIIYLIGKGKTNNKHFMDALRYGQNDYVVKDHMSEVYLQIEQTIQKIQAHSIHSKLKNPNSVSLQDGLAIDRNQYLSSIAQGLIIPDYHSFRRYGIQLDMHRDVCIVLGSVKKGSSNPMSQIQSLADAYLGNDYVVERCVLLNNSILWIIQFKQRYLSWQDNIQSLRHKFDEVRTACNRTMHIAISFIIQSAAVKWIYIPHVYNRMDRIRVQCESFWQTGVVTERFAQSFLDYHEVDVLARLRRQLQHSHHVQSYIEQGDVGRASRWVDELFDLFHMQTDYGILTEACMSLGSTLLKTINDHQLQDQLDDRYSPDKLFTTVNTYRLERKKQYYLDAINAIHHAYQCKVQEQAQRVIRKVEDYIRTHVDKTITLRDLAEVVHLNPESLHQLFEKFSTRSLDEIIHECRLQYAKTLLNNSYLQMHQIAYRVGFRDVSQFYQFFENAECMTPEEYKEQGLSIAR